LNWSLVPAKFLERDHDFGRLNRVRSGPGTQEEIRFWKFEVFKKGFRHFIVIILPDMDNLTLNLIILKRFSIYWRYFHEIRTSTGRLLVTLSYKLIGSRFRVLGSRVIKQMISDFVSMPGIEILPPFIIG